MSKLNQNPNVESVPEVLLRNKKKIVLVPLLTLVAGALFFALCPRSYRSEARLFLRVGRESVGIDPTATAGQTMQLYTADRMDEVTSAEQVFGSRAVAAKVVDRLGADVVLGRGGAAKVSSVVADVIKKPISLALGLMKSFDPISEREEAIIRLEQSLKVSAERKATVILVQYTANSPQLAQTICQAIVEVAQQEHMRVHRSEGSTPFFSEQLQLLREQVEQSLNALRDAKNELGLADIEQRRETLEAQFSAIELDRLSTNQQLATSQARIENLQQQLSEIPERLISSKRTVPNNGADMLRDRFYELQVESMGLQARYKDSHPLVVTAVNQMKEAQKVLAEQAELRTETTDDVNPIHRDLSLSMNQEQSVVEGLKARLAELDRQTDAVLVALRTLNQQDLKLDQLARDAELARDKYMQYARTMEESRIDTALKNEGVSNISVLQAATLAERPVVPSRALTIAGTLALAMFGTFGLVLHSERQNRLATPARMMHPAERRSPRRPASRKLLSKANGLSEENERQSVPK